MPSKRFRLAVPLRKYTTEDGKEKTVWGNIGSMFDNGDHFTIILDSYPLPDKESGQVRFMAFPAEKSEEPAVSTLKRIGWKESEDF